MSGPRRRPAGIRATIVLIMAAVGGPAHAVPGTDQPPPPAPPTVAQRSDEAERSAAGFGLPEGFTAELFAAEPDVANPVAFSVDERGRVFVCETFRQGRGVIDNRGRTTAWVDADLAAQSVADRLAYHLRLLGEKARDFEAFDDRVRMLTDSDGDGRADAATVWAEGFNRVIEGTAAGILARRGEVFLTCIPSLLRLRDLDRDGRIDASPEERRVLSTGYGVRVAYRGHDLHGLTLGPDGRLYYSVGDRGFRLEHDGVVDAGPGTGAVFRCNPDGSGLEVFARGLRNPQELAFDDLGNLFTVDNNSDAGDKARFVHVVPGGDSGWDMALQYLPDRGPWHREKLWHLAAADQPAWHLPPLAHMTSGPSGFAASPGTGLGPHLDGRFFIVDFRGSPAQSAIRSFRLRRKGATFEPFDEEQTFRNVLATDVEIGPDGAVWVADWVEGWLGVGKGRLWRFRPSGQDARGIAEVRELLAADWAAFDPTRLVALLAHADRRIRLEAQWELARREDTTCFAALLDDPARPMPQRVHAAFGLGQIVRTSGDPAAVRRLAAAVGDAAWEVRLVAARSLGECPPDSPERRLVREALVQRLDDGEPHVRAAAATAIGLLGRRAGDDPAAVAVLMQRAVHDIDADAYLRHALVMGLAGVADNLGPLATHPAPQVRLAACLAMRRRAEPAIADLLDDPEERIVLEAARAIHDVPIPAALPALAMRAARGPATDPFIRRAVSAAERLGTAAAAEELVAVAARRDAPEEIRVQAIDALRSWTRPPSRNRVTGVWQPHALPRDAAFARAALEGRLDDLVGGATGSPSSPEGNDAIQLAALDAAAALGITRVQPLLVAWCGDPARAAASRARAIETLLACDAGIAARTAAALLDDAVPLVRMAAMKVRAATAAAAEVVPELVVATAAPDLRERQAAVELLGTLAGPAATAAVEQLVSGIGSDPAIELEIREAAERRLGKEAAARLTPRPADNDSVAAFREVLAGGDATAGRKVFFSNVAVSCVRCHKAERVGGDVGPALDGIGGRRDRRHLLESIVHPDAKVEESHRTTLIVTDAGLVVAGIVIAETADELHLRKADGAIATIPVSEIDERSAGPSSMPADLAAKLSRRELRDLVEWLASLR